jgi:sigma-B regulation protein RsbU (phosphoserine phosphatase)
VQVLVDERRSVAEIMTRLNQLTSANCPANRFISLFLCIADGRSGEISYCNAGHNPPLIVRAAGSAPAYEELTGGGPILGIIDSVEYEECHARLAPGDVLVIYSDGVTEACNNANEEFQVQRLVGTVYRNRERNAVEILEAVNRAVCEYCDGAAASDDITLVVARRLSQ